AVVGVARVHLPAPREDAGAPGFARDEDHVGIGDARGALRRSLAGLLDTHRRLAGRARVALARLDAHDGLAGFGRRAVVRGGAGADGATSTPAASPGSAATSPAGPSRAAAVGSSPGTLTAPASPSPRSSAGPSRAPSSVGRTSRSA